MEPGGGFTLIVLVAALAILAVLSAVSISPIKMERQRA
jgi:type II secretory pathway pseudopilin PulG